MHVEISSYRKVLIEISSYRNGSAISPTQSAVQEHILFLWSWMSEKYRSHSSLTHTLYTYQCTYSCFTSWWLHWRGDSLVLSTSPSLCFDFSACNGSCRDYSLNRYGADLLNVCHSCMNSCILAAAHCRERWVAAAREPQDYSELSLKIRSVSGQGWDSPWNWLFEISGWKRGYPFKTEKERPGFTYLPGQTNPVGK